MNAGAACRICIESDGQRRTKADERCEKTQQGEVRVVDRRTEPPPPPVLSRALFTACRLQTLIRVHHCSTTAPQILRQQIFSSRTFLGCKAFVYLLGFSRAPAELGKTLPGLCGTESHQTKAITL